MGFTHFFSGTQRTGQRHWKAKQPDSRVEEARVLHEEQGWGYRRIARHMEVPRSTIQFWCTYRRR